jgi:nucleoside-diphosphate-sugar epimerase
MMDFVKDILSKKRILIKGSGEQKRAFCYISDVITGIFLILNTGKNGEAYNLGNPNEFFSIKKLAYKLSAFNNKIPVKISIKSNSKKKFLQYDNVRPSIKKISNLGFKPSVGIKKGFEKTIKYFYSVI